MKKVITLILLLSVLLGAVLFVVSCESKEEKLERLNQLTYEEYKAMTPEEKREHYDAYKDVLGEDEGVAAFFEWLNAAKEEANQGGEEIGGDTEIDLGKNNGQEA